LGKKKRERALAKNTTGTKEAEVGRNLKTLAAALAMNEEGKKKPALVWDPEPEKRQGILKAVGMRLLTADQTKRRNKCLGNWGLGSGGETAGCKKKKKNMKREITIAETKKQRQMREEELKKGEG